MRLFKFVVIVLVFNLYSTCFCSKNDNGEIGLNSENRKMTYSAKDATQKNRDTREIQIVKKETNTSNDRYSMNSYEENEIEFIGNGKILKRINLRQVVEEIKIYDKKNPKKQWSGMRKRSKTGTVSRHKKYALIAEKWTEEPKLKANDVNSTNLAYPQPVAGGSIALYNDTGTVEWEKKMETGRTAGGGLKDIQVADNGYTAVLSYVEYSNDENYHPEITLYNFAGSEIMTLSEENSKYYDIKEFLLSPKGKYLAVKYFEHLVIYDIEQRKSKDFGRCSFGEIDDDAKKVKLICVKGESGKNGYPSRWIELSNFGE